MIYAIIRKLEKKKIEKEDRIERAKKEEKTWELTRLCREFLAENEPQWKVDKILRIEKKKLELEKRERHLKIAEKQRELKKKLLKDKVQDKEKELTEDSRKEILEAEKKSQRL